TAEQRGDALDRQILDDIDELTAAIVAPARQALGVLVGQYRALGLQDGLADDVLGRDQFDLVALAADLAANGGSNVRVGLGERGGKGGMGGGRGCGGLLHGNLRIWPLAVGADWHGQLWYTRAEAAGIPERRHLNGDSMCRRESPKLARFRRSDFRLRRARIRP